MSDQTPTDTGPPSTPELRDFFSDNHELIAAIANFRRVFHIYRNQVERSFALQGLTHLQYAVLLALCAHDPEAPFTVGELTEHFQLSNPACVQLLNRMESRGLLRRVEEGNVARIIPTEMGMRTIYSLITASRPSQDPPVNLRGNLVAAIVEASRLEQRYFASRGVPFPIVPFTEDTEDDAPPSSTT